MPYPVRPTLQSRFGIHTQHSVRLSMLQGLAVPESPVLAFDAAVLPTRNVGESRDSILMMDMRQPHQADRQQHQPHGVQPIERTILSQDSNRHFYDKADNSDKRDQVIKHLFGESLLFEHRFVE